MITQGPRNYVITDRNGLDALLLGRRVIRILLRERLVARTRAVIRRARTSGSIPVLHLLIRHRDRLVMIIASLLCFAPCQFPDLIRDKDLYVHRHRTVRRAKIILRFRSWFKEIGRQLSFMEGFMGKFTLHVCQGVRLGLSIKENGALYRYCTTRRRGRRRTNWFYASYFRISRTVFVGLYSEYGCERREGAL